MPYRHTIGQRTYVFDDLKTLLARATPLRSGDVLAGVAAATYEERVAASTPWPMCRCALFSTKHWCRMSRMRSPA